MIINNVGYNHKHDADFIIERPFGSGDCLFLLLKTDSIFTLGGEDRIVAKNSVFIYPLGMPQYYKAVPMSAFENDWIHFLFEDNEEEQFLNHRIPYATPISLSNTEFYSFCIKMIAEENSGKHLYSKETIQHYFNIMLNKLSEYLHENEVICSTSQYEMMLTIRNKIYSNPEVPRSIDWVAHEISMSRSSFQHLYKKYFGVTFVQDLLNSRISFAKMLLVTTDLSIGDISGKCGFRNYEHFARIFKRKCGMSSIDYRSQNKSKSQQ